MSVMENRENVIRKSLEQFLCEHSLDIADYDVDEVLLSYIVSMLDDLGNTDATTEADFDVESFAEVMEAYLTGFSEIKTEAVCAWMFRLMAELNDKREEENGRRGLDDKSCKLSEMIKSTALVTPVPAPTADVARLTMGAPGDAKKRRSSRHSESSSGCYSMTDSDDDASFDLLMEMFPSACSLDVRQCLSVCRGDVDGAAQLLLQRNDHNQQEQSKSQSFLMKTQKKANEEDVKSVILERYSYIDIDEEKKSFRPPPPKYEPKKMIRYLDNKVVSTKGERFTEIKLTEEEQRVKATKPRHH